MIKWLIKSNRAESSEVVNGVHQIGAVAEEVGRKCVNDIFCDNAKIL